MSWASSLLIAALMVGVGLGPWLVGLLRGVLPMEVLYRLSVCYPVLVLAVIVLRPAAKSAPAAAGPLS